MKEKKRVGAMVEDMFNILIWALVNIGNIVGLALAIIGGLITAIDILTCMPTSNFCLIGPSMMVLIIGLALILCTSFFGDLLLND